MHNPGSIVPVTETRPGGFVRGISDISNKGGGWKRASWSFFDGLHGGLAADACPISRDSVYDVGSVSDTECSHQPAVSSGKLRTEKDMWEFRLVLFVEGSHLSTRSQRTCPLSRQFGAS